MSRGVEKRRAAANGDGPAAYQERRREVVEAAGAVFKERGYHNTSINDIGQALNIGRASVYYYIGSKEELFHEVVGEAIESSVRAAELIQESSVPAAEKVRQLINALMHSYEEHYPFLYVYIQEDLNQVGRPGGPWAEGMAQMNKRYEAAVISILQEGYDDGTLRQLAPAKVIAYGLIGIIAWTNRWFRPDQSVVSAREIAQAYGEMLLNGLVT